MNRNYKNAKMFTSRMTESVDQIEMINIQKHLQQESEI